MKALERKNLVDEWKNKKGPDENVNSNSSASSASSANVKKSCEFCGETLSGKCIEVMGMQFHMDCFKCCGCNKKLLNSCLNINNKPYCDACGKTAFIQSTKQNNK